MSERQLESRLTAVAAAIAILALVVSAPLSGRGRRAYAEESAPPAASPSPADSAAQELRSLTGEPLREPATSPAQAIERWTDAPQRAARAMMEKYGPPDEVTDNALVWHDNGPWRLTVVHREERQHDFPYKHVDTVEQAIPYRVPVDRFDDLARLNGSLLADRTGGLLTSRCESEAMNVLALNVADELVNGRRSVDESRRFMARAAALRSSGKASPQLEGLLFRTYGGGLNADPDKPLK